MKVKLDENLPAGITETLRRLAHDIETVPGEGLSGREDAVVWK